MLGSIIERRMMTQLVKNGVLDGVESGPTEGIKREGG
jgi:hypothetical protein